MKKNIIGLILMLSLTLSASGVFKKTNSKKLLLDINFSENKNNNIDYSKIREKRKKFINIIFNDLNITQTIEENHFNITDKNEELSKHNSSNETTAKQENPKSSEPSSITSSSNSSLKINNDFLFNIYKNEDFSVVNEFTTLDLKNNSINNEFNKKINQKYVENIQDRLNVNNHKKALESIIIKSINSQIELSNSDMKNIDVNNYKDETFQHLSPFTPKDNVTFSQLFALNSTMLTSSTIDKITKDFK